ncbi:MAG: 2-phosphosulfolactate phosphatase [Candidatus Thermoplasmatota archaeon]
MDICIEHFVSGAKKAEGVAVIIDVFRACTTAAYVFNSKAKKIIPIGEIEKCFSLKKQNPDFVLLGERNGIKIDGFDYGNSPSKVKEIDFRGKTVVMSTSAGTQGIVNADKVDKILLGSFVNVDSTLKYIERLKPRVVSFVPCGIAGKKYCKEDFLCAEYMKKTLLDENPDFNGIKQEIKDYKTSMKFFDEEQPVFPEEDFYCSMNLNRFNFVMKAYKNNGLWEIKKIKD